MLGDVKLDNGADLEDIYCALCNVEPGMIDQVRMAQLHDASDCVVEPRQLGDWIPVIVDAAKQSVNCDCKQCNQFGLCSLSASMCVIYFNQNIPNYCKQVNGGFSCPKIRSTQ